LKPTKMKAKSGVYTHLLSKGSQQRLELNWLLRFVYLDYKEGDELDNLAFSISVKEDIH
jgi:hypothetical protein